jgi:hypothetical protein
VTTATRRSRRSCVFNRSTCKTGTGGTYGSRSLPFTLVAVLLIRAIAAAQAHAPVVTMSVTLPDGRRQELTAPESGLATLTLKDGTAYGFRPTIQDSSPWTRIVVTIFKSATSSSPATVLGEIELRRGGPVVDSKTNASFKVSVPKVSAPTSQTGSSSHEIERPAGALANATK